MITERRTPKIPLCRDGIDIAKAIELTNHLLSPHKPSSDRKWVSNSSQSELADKIVSIWYKQCDLSNCQCRQQNMFGWHPIHLTALLGNQQLIMEILDKERGIVNAEYHFNEPPITPLMCGAAGGFVEVMKLLLQAGANFSYNPIKDLEWSIKGKNPQCFRYVVENADILKLEGKVDMLELFMTGVLKDDAVDILEILLSMRIFRNTFAKNLDLPTMRRIRNVLASKIEMNHRALFFLVLEKGYKEVLKLLLKLAKINPNNQGMLPLHHTIHNQTKDELAAEILEILVNSGASINTRDVKGKTALNIAANAGYVKCAFVLTQMEADISVSDLKSLNERVPQFLKTYLDNLISSKGMTSSPSGELVSIDIRFMGVKRHGKATKTGSTKQELFEERMKMREDCKELEFLSFVIEDGQGELLLHPVIQTYLYTKWIICRKYFYFSALLYLIQLLSFTILVTTKYEGVEIVRNNDLKATSQDTESAATTTDSTTILWITVFGTSTLILTRSLALLHSLLLGNWKAQVFKHSFEIVLIISALVTMLPLSSSSELNFQRGMASISILLAWCYSLFQLQKHPKLGIYVEMLSNVFKNFATFFLTYTCVLIGYALAFSVILPKNSDFKTLISCLREILTWMVGEMDIPKRQEVDLPILVNVLYISFILTVTVALINLLIGLAVHDIQGLLLKSKLNESIRQVHYLHLIHSIINSKLVSKVAPRAIRKYLRRSITLPLHVHIVTIFPNKSDDKRLPLALKQEALVVAKRNMDK